MSPIEWRRVTKVSCKYRHFLTKLNLDKLFYLTINRMKSKTYLGPASALYLLAISILDVASLGQNDATAKRINDSKDLSSLDSNNQKGCNIKLNKIVGNVYSLQHDDLTTLRMSLMNTKILVNYGQYIAYPKEDGSFEVDNLPSDSYVVEVTHPKFIYEPVRVDITSKGKIRARKVNYIQPSLVQTVEYPLKFRPKSLHNYFTPRETWRIMDLLFNPMVIMMVVPLVIIWLLPKMMNPQEAQTQRDNMQMPEYNVPELSEMMASMFGGQGGSNQATGASNQVGQAGNNQAITAGPGGGGSSSKHGKHKRR